MAKAPQNRAHAFRRGVAINSVMMVAVLFLLNFAVSGIGVKVDLTANGRFSVNQGTVEILRSLNQPVTLKYYVSAQRPADLAALESEIVDRLTALAEAAGPQHLVFDARRDVLVIEGAARDWQAQNPDLRVREVRMPTASVEVAFISSVQVIHPAVRADKPLQLSVTRADALEYRLALEVVKLKGVRVRPDGDLT
ncbi:MAG: Gldg family protein, partial [Planctomycetes bacterium]|nr:Gldg family protein [Planctomycetota bacterium]